MSTELDGHDVRTLLATLVHVIVEDSIVISHVPEAPELDCAGGCRPGFEVGRVESTNLRAVRATGSTSNLSDKFYTSQATADLVEVPAERPHRVHSVFARAALLHEGAAEAVALGNTKRFLSK